MFPSLDDLRRLSDGLGFSAGANVGFVCARLASVLSVIRLLCLFTVTLPRWSMSADG